LVFNGEIFNYVELRPDLESRGHTFRTNTDTEVLLHLFEEYGPECLHRLNGQFAFAIWNSRSQRLFAGRDRLGIRPFFYAETPHGLLFASEAKALLTQPEVTRELDLVSLDQVFTYWSPLRGRSAFSGVLELPPGHLLTHSSGQITTRQYWDLSFPEEAVTQEQVAPTEQYVDEFTDLLCDATRLRLRADVPVAAYLSGGLDSSLTTSIVRSRFSNSLATFSIAFDDPQFDESGFQQHMSQVLGTRHEVVRTTHADIGRVFPQVVWHTEVPLTRTAPAPMFLLSQLVHDSGFKVALTGEGADEFLAGYDIFKEAAIRRFCARQSNSRLRPELFRRIYGDISNLGTVNPAFLSAFFQTGSRDEDSLYFSHLVRWRNTARTRRFLSQEIRHATDGPGVLPRLPAQAPRWGRLQRAQYLEASLFLSQYLLSSQGDRVGMAHSVESRLPFLDYRVVEFCNALPTRLKLRGLRDKFLLRQMGRKFLPPEVWNRPKRPYRAPIYRSFFSPAPDYVHELLSPRSILTAGYFDGQAVTRLVGKAAEGAGLSETDEMALVGILSTQLLHHQFVTHSPYASPVSKNLDDVRIISAPKTRAAAGYAGRSEIIALGDIK
jgi:asparagine synthase (glutamine-hydrolysing)